VLGIVVVGGCLTALSAAPAAATTTSAFAEGIDASETVTATSSSASVSGSNTEITVSVPNMGGIRLRPPQGQTLTTGTYENAKWYILGDPLGPNPGIFFGPIDGGVHCDAYGGAPVQGAGRFIIDELHYSGGVPDAIAVRFEQRCEPYPKISFGAFSVNATTTYPTHVFSPPTVAFGTQHAGQPSPHTTVQFTNTGATTLHIDSISLTGTDAAQFSATTACPGQDLAPSASCSIDTAFSPSGPTGPRSATLRIFDNISPVGGSGRPFYLSGTAKPPLVSGVINVPANFPTIQAAINAAVDGNTVVVAPGTYNEFLDFRGKSIEVRSARGPDVTVVNAQGASDAAAVFYSGEDALSVLRGFTLEGSSQFGVWLDLSSPTIVGNVITNNYYGIKAHGSASLISDNVIDSNQSCAGAISGGGKGLDISNNLISNNCGGIFVNEPGVVIEGNLIEGNNTFAGGGIAATGAGDLVIRRNVIQNNVASYGGGISIQDATNNADVVDNLIVGNQAFVSGGGIYTDIHAGTDVTGLRVVNNTISGNSPVGIEIHSVLHPASLYNNVVTDDLTCPAGAPTLVSNNVSHYLNACAAAAGTNGNISLDPQFVDAAAGNYQLQATSPSRDAGTNGAPALPSTDLRGVPRIWHGVVDQGAFEFYVPKQPAHLSGNNLLPRRHPVSLGAASSAASTESAATPNQATPSAGAAGTAVSPGGSPARRLQLVTRSSSRGVRKASTVSTRRWRTLRFW
jgi:parallel beta-helix repeat protein